MNYNFNFILLGLTFLDWEFIWTLFKWSALAIVGIIFLMIIGIIVPAIADSIGAVVTVLIQPISNFVLVIVDFILSPFRYIAEKLYAFSEQLREWAGLDPNLAHQTDSAGWIIILIGAGLAVYILFSWYDTSLTFPQNPKVGSKITRDTDGMTMLYVSGGTFKMGSSDSDTQADDNEKPQHNVTVGSFWIDKTEVTNAQYQNCVRAGICKQSGRVDDSDFNGDNQPVVGIDWNDAYSYCGWVGGRLPTEAEWEYAARGKDGRIYPWGNKFDGTKANSLGNGDGYANTAPVDSYPDGASWVGALDMSGNVWEWTQSEYKDYSYDANDGREDIKEIDIIKVLRGGSWDYDFINLSAANRHTAYDFYRSSNIGFRCVGIVP